MSASTVKETSVAVASLSETVKVKEESKLPSIDIYNIRSIEEVAKIPVTDMRSNISKLTVKCFFPELAYKKPRGLWSKAPSDWPASIPFQDPHNKSGAGPKLKKPDLIRMLIFLIRRQHGLQCDTLEMPEQPYGSNSAEQPGPSQPRIDPEVPTSFIPRTPMEVSSQGAIPETMQWSQTSEKVPRNVECVERKDCQNVNRNVPRQVKRYITPKHQIDIVRRLTEQVNNKTTRKDHVNEMLMDRLRGCLTSISSIGINKAMLKLLHNMEYFVELERDAVDETDKNQFREDIATLESMLNPEAKITRIASNEQGYNSDKHERGTENTLVDTNPTATQTNNIKTYADKPMHGNTSIKMQGNKSPMELGGLSQTNKLLTTQSGILHPQSITPSRIFESSHSGSKPPIINASHEEKPMVLLDQEDMKTKTEPDPELYSSCQHTPRYVQEMGNVVMEEHSYCAVTIPVSNQIPQVITEEAAKEEDDDEEEEIRAPSTPSNVVISSESSSYQCTPRCVQEMGGMVMEEHSYCTVTMPVSNQIPHVVARYNENSDDENPDEGHQAVQNISNDEFIEREESENNNSSEPEEVMKYEPQNASSNGLQDIQIVRDGDGTPVASTPAPAPVHIHPPAPAPAHIHPPAPAPVHIHHHAPAPAHIHPPAPAPAHIHPPAPAPAHIHPPAPALAQSNHTTPAPAQINPTAPAHNNPELFFQHPSNSNAHNVKHGHVSLSTQQDGREEKMSQQRYIESIPLDLSMRSRERSTDDTQVDTSPTTTQTNTNNIKTYAVKPIHGNTSIEMQGNHSTMQVGGLPQTNKLPTTQFNHLAPLSGIPHPQPMTTSRIFESSYSGRNRPTKHGSREEKRLVLLDQEGTQTKKQKTHERQGVTETDPDIELCCFTNCDNDNEDEEMRCAQATPTNNVVSSGSSSSYQRTPQCVQEMGRRVMNEHSYCAGILPVGSQILLGRRTRRDTRRRSGDGERDGERGKKRTWTQIE